jgi:hypothetical protein
MNRRFAIAALLVCLGVSMVLVFVPTAEAKCRPPRISVSTAKGERDTAITIAGETFWLRCIDEGVLPLPPMQPTRNIQILLKQGDQSTLLATVDADVNLRFSVTVTIPANAAPGKATIIAKADAYPAAAGEIPQPIAFEVIESGQR